MRSLRTDQPSDRRAVVLLAMVLVMAMMHLLVVSSLAPAKGEGEIAALRVETIRAFYAAEAGSFVVMRAITDGNISMDPPQNIDLDTAEAVFVEWPTAELVSCVVEGHAGRAVRRVRLEFGP